MSKRLENFIKNNSEEFDDLEPGNDLWSKIEAKLPATEDHILQIVPKRNTPTFSLGFVMRVAASIIVVMAVGFVIYIKTLKTDAGSNNTQPSSAAIAAKINPEFARQQAQYVSLVATKRTELKTLAKNDPQLYNEFMGELSKMDSTYKKLNRDLVTSPDQESVLRAMIRNLQIQTEVLNQQLQVIEEFNNSKKEQSHHEIKDI